MLRFWCVLAALGLGLPAAAQPSGGEVFSDLLSCDPLTDPARRLACYDSVLKQYKIRFGVIEGRADELAEDSNSRPAMRPEPVERTPLPAPARVERPRPEPTVRSERARRPASESRRAAAASADDLELPHETRITGYNANTRGDFRLRIAEGLVFEDAGGPGFNEDPTGKTVILSKNFLGNWRMEVPGEAQRIWLRPVESGTDAGAPRRTAGTGASDGDGDSRGEAARADAAAERTRTRSSRPPRRVSDLELPVETLITGYNANSRGDFRLRIAEGFVFEDAGGPGFSEDPNGKTVTLSKNFLGNWRMEVPGEAQLIWLRPVETSPGGAGRSAAERSAPPEGSTASRSGDSSAGDTRNAGRDGAREGAGSSASSAPPRSVSDLDLPHETRITGYNANARGDFRLRTAEGFIFEDAGGTGFTEDPTGKTVTLTKNFLGNWRMEVPGEAQLVWIRPVEDGG